MNGKIHFIGHRELGVLLVYQFQKNGKDKLKIANITQKQIADLATAKNLQPDAVFAEIAYQLALSAKTLDVRNGISNNTTDADKLKYVTAAANSVAVDILAGQTVSDADFTFAVEVDHDSEGGFQMGRFSTDLGPVKFILETFSNPKDTKTEKDLSIESTLPTLKAEMPVNPFGTL
jgi:hypothetical protein